MVKKNIHNDKIKNKIEKGTNTAAAMGKLG